MAGFGVDYSQRGTVGSTNGPKGRVPSAGREIGPGAGVGSPAQYGATSVPGTPQQQQAATLDPNMLKMITGMMNQPAQAVPAINNTSTPNPQAQSANNMLMKRAEGDMGASDAMRMSGIANADNAAMLMADARKGASRRGVGNSSVGDVLSSGIASDAMRANAGANSQIAFNSERAKDAQLNTVHGNALSQDSGQNDQRRLALDQYSVATNAAAEQQRMQQDKLKTVLGLLGPSGGLF